MLLSSIAPSFFATCQKNKKMIKSQVKSEKK